MLKEGTKLSNNDFGIASLVFGILSILLFFTIVHAIILGLLGIIFGFIQRKKSKNKWALWGIILSVVGLALALWVAWLILSWITQITELIETCKNNPSLKGCEEIYKFIQSGQGVNGY